MTGIDAAKRRFATEAVPAAELEERTMNLALRVAKIPSDLLAFNKKSVHRAFEAMGMRTNIRNGVDLEALMFKAPGAKMLTVRRGPQRGTHAAQRVPPPRPAAAVSGPSVAAQAVSAKSQEEVQIAKPATAPKAAPAASATPAARKVGAPVATATKPSAAPAKNAIATTKAPTTAKAPVATPMKAAPPKTPSVAASPKVAAPVTPQQQAPVVQPASRASATPQSSKVDKNERTEDGGVHVHLHEAVHIHIGTPSKL